MFKILVPIISLLISNSAFAHGEDKLGPNGGFVRMPGAFHTEVVPQSKNTLKVFLLDIQWKNPSVTKSDLKIILDNKTKATCEIKENYYLCSFPEFVDLNKTAELKVTAQREGQKGMDATYRLPLKLEMADGAQDHKK